MVTRLIGLATVVAVMLAAVAPYARSTIEPSIWVAIVVSAVLLATLAVSKLLLHRR